MSAGRGWPVLQYYARERGVATGKTGSPLHSNSGATMTMSQHDDLREHTALVTGATSGIGRAIAVQFARMGADVLVHGRDATRGGQVVGEIEGAGGMARFVAADLSDPADLQRLVEAVGDVDVLVNSAGFSWFGPTAALDLHTFHH